MLPKCIYQNTIEMMKKGKILRLEMESENTYGREKNHGQMKR